MGEVMRGNYFRELAKRAVEQGWRVEPTNGKHLRWLSPSGGIVISSSTPSDHRALRNHLSIMRRYGFVDR